MDACLETLNALHLFPFRCVIVPEPAGHLLWIVPSLGGFMALASAAPRNHLLHILGVAFSVAVALGSMIGSGIMGAPARIAHDIDSIWVIIALWAIGAVHAALAANVYAELGTSV